MSPRYCMELLNHCNVHLKLTLHYVNSTGIKQKQLKKSNWKKNKIVFRHCKTKQKPPQQTIGNLLDISQVHFPKQKKNFISLVYTQILSYLAWTYSSKITYNHVNMPISRGKVKMLTSISNIQLLQIKYQEFFSFISLMKPLPLASPNLFLVGRRGLNITC